MGWFDGLAVGKDAPNADGAHAFINWMIDPTFYVEWATKVGAPASANHEGDGGAAGQRSDEGACLRRPGSHQAPAIHGAAHRRRSARTIPISGPK